MDIIKMDDKKENKFVYVYSAQKEKQKQATSAQIIEVERIRKKYTVKEISFEEKANRIKKSVQKFSIISIGLRGLFGIALLLSGIFLICGMNMFAMGFAQIFIGGNFIAFLFAVYKKIKEKLKEKFQEKFV